MALITRRTGRHEGDATEELTPTVLPPAAAYFLGRSLGDLGGIPYFPGLTPDAPEHDETVTALIDSGDHNGSLANWELQAALASRGCELSMAQVDRLMWLYDESADGVLDADELQLAVDEGVLLTDAAGLCAVDFSAVSYGRPMQMLVNAGDHNGSLANWELQAALAAHGLVMDMGGIDRLMALYDENADGVVDADELMAMFSESVLAWDPATWTVSYDAGAVLEPRILERGVLPPGEPTADVADADGDKLAFIQAIKTLSDPDAQHAMDLLEVLEDSGMDNGRFGTRGMQLLAGLSATDEATWEQVAPGSSVEQRQAWIDAAQVALAPEHGVFLAEVHGGDAIFESDDLSNWLDDQDDGDVSDQQIGPSQQQGVGDCFVLASINALANSQAGRDIFERSIVQNADGSCTVTFAGDPEHPITVTADEVASNDDGFSVGDPDMNVLELALDKYAAQHPEEMGISTSKDGGQPMAVLALLTGSSDGLGCGFDPALTRDCLELLAPSLRDGTLALTFSTKMGEEGTFGDVPGDSWHALTVLDIDLEAGTVTFVNPWDSGKPITMSIDEFSAKVDGFQFTVLA